MRGGRAQQQGVAIRLGPRHEVGAYRSPTAGLVLYDHRLAQLLFQLARQRPPQHIGGAARRIRIDQRDRLTGIAVRRQARTAAHRADGQAAQQSLQGIHLCLLILIGMLFLYC
ncbi:hypothetical protein D3C72_1139630 [compost metagenome]